MVRQRTKGVIRLTPLLCLLGLMLCIFVIPFWAANPPLSAERIIPKAKSSFVDRPRDIQIGQFSPKHEECSGGDNLSPLAIGHPFLYIHTNSQSRRIRSLRFPFRSGRHQSLMSQFKFCVLWRGRQIVRGIGVVPSRIVPKQPSGCNTDLFQYQYEYRAVAFRGDRYPSSLFVYNRTRVSQSGFRRYFGTPTISAMS